jgi:hypothetical protein
VLNMDKAFEDTAAIGSTVGTGKRSDGLVMTATKGFLEIRQDQTRRNNKRQQHHILAAIRWKTSRKKVVETLILQQTAVLGFLIDTFFNVHGKIAPDENGTLQRTLKLRCFTEYQRNGFVYRCHPLYRGEYAYYDWCYVNWAVQNNENPFEEQTIRLLGRIHLFVETPEGDIKAVVQSVMERTDEDYGVFGTYWYLEENENGNRPRFELADVDSLGDHALVLPYDQTEKRFIHFHDRSEWPGYFQTMEPPEED